MTLSVSYRLSVVLLAAATTSIARSQQAEPQRLLVRFKPEVAEARIQRTLATNGLSELRRIDSIGVRVISLPTTAAKQGLVERLRTSGDVKFVEVDRKVREAQSSTIAPNDPWYEMWQPQLRQINCPAAWAYTRGTSNVVIAILDSGVNGVPDLSSKLLSGWNAITNNPDWADVRGHGTMVAAVAAASSNNALGIASVAWNCKVLPVRVSDSNGVAYYSDLAAGVVWAAEHGARVVNLSFTLERDSTLEAALQLLRSKGGVAVCSAGNTGGNSGSGPNPYILTVAGTDAYGQRSVNSSFGQDVDISAPYTSMSATRDGSYTAVGGTSFSAPQVAGAAALVISANPGLTSAQVEQILLTTATDSGSAGWDPYTGYGQVNVGHAVARALGTIPQDLTPPSVRFISPSQGAVLSGPATVASEASDDNDISKVVFQVDGIVVAEILAPPYSFVWQTTHTSEGLHRLTSLAVDRAGNASSAHLDVTVRNFVDAQPPTVTIVSPTSGSKLGRSVKVTGNAFDNVGITKVEVLLDGHVVGHSTAAPFTIQWSSKNVPAGMHSLQCRAFDPVGNVGWSQMISVRK